MLGRKSGFQTRVKAVSPSLTSVHCFLHQCALAARLLPSDIKTSLNLVVKMVNYIKTSALNSRLFKASARISDQNTRHCCFIRKSLEGIHCASFCAEKGAASVFPNKRSQISEDS